MQACAFDAYLTQITQLTRAQCARVFALLKPAVDREHTAAVIEEAVAARLCCPQCQGKQLYRHGIKSGLQRFRCRACDKTFNSLTGTPLARLRYKDKWLAFSECMLDSRTVRKAAARVEVAKNTSLPGATAFWRSPKPTVPPACTASQRLMKPSCSNRKKARAT